MLFIKLLLYSNDVFFRGDSMMVTAARVPMMTSYLRMRNLLEELGQQKNCQWRAHFDSNEKRNKPGPPGPEQ